jgi:hypothetical protein
MRPPENLTPSEQKVLSDRKKIGFKKVLDPLFDEFKNESDRVAVIAGGAQLDALLAELLAHFFIDGPRNPADYESDPLLAPDRPLGSFSARIKMAERLGLIGRQFAGTLDLIRKIRNDFAHKVAERTLNKSPHRERIFQLSINLPSPTFWEDAIARFGEDTPASRFRAVVSVAVAMLAGDVHSVVAAQKQPLLSTNWDSNRRWPPTGKKVAKKTKGTRPAGQQGVAPDDRSPSAPARG